MGKLKEDIQQAFENSIDGNSDRITQLAIDLEKAIEDFIVNQTFRVDKLSMTHEGLKTKPILPPAKSTLPAAVGVPVFTPIPDREISNFSMGVDKDGGQSDNPIQNGEAQSNASEVRLRENEVNRNYK